MFPILLCIAAAVLIIDGISNLFGSQMFYKQAGKKYTEESVKKWIRPNGVALIIIGVGVLLINIPAIVKGLPAMFNGAGCALVLVGFLLSFFLSNKLLEEKDADHKMKM